MAKHPDVFTRSIKMDGTIDLEKLKKLSRELQEDYERIHFQKTILEDGHQDIINRVNTRDNSTGMLRDGGWASRRASQAIQEANVIESRGFIEEQQRAQSPYQTINLQP